jgi:hypothetical protein
MAALLDLLKNWDFATAAEIVGSAAQGACAIGPPSSRP